MGGFYAKRHNTGQQVARNELRVGLLVHLSYTNFSCVWRITSIEAKQNGEVWLNLIAPDSGKTKHTNAIYARHIRANER